VSEGWDLQVDLLKIFTTDCADLQMGKRGRKTLRGAGCGGFVKEVDARSLAVQRDWVSG